MSFLPLGNRVLVKRSLPPETTPSGIYVPAVAREDIRQGTVIAIGDKVLDLPVGSLVLLPQFGGTPVPDGTLFGADEILGIITMS